MQTLTNDILGAARSAGCFSTLLEAIESAGLTQALSAPGPFTVLAPDDEAFKKIPRETLQRLLADHAQLAHVLSLHVLSGKHMAADVVRMTTAPSLEGMALPVQVDDRSVHIGGAKLLSTDIDCANGVVHVIDTVLMPQ